MKPIKIKKGTFRKGFADVGKKTQKFFDIEEQIKREEKKMANLKKKEKLFDLREKNLKIQSKLKPAGKDPFKDFLS
ncbi:MAG: hypothetical protein R6U59_08030 [Eubacteriales bacterium]